MRFGDALGIQKGDVVAFVGAGGKTSALIRLGHELAAQGWRVVGTTTTRIAEEELNLFPQTARWESNLLYGERKLAQLLDEHRFVFVYQSIKADKAQGIPEEYIRELLDNLNADALLIEADGARRLPVKAPMPYEPVIPSDTTIVVPIVGLDAIGQPLDETVVYNLDPIIEKYGFPYGTPIQPVWLAQILRDEEFGLKNIPLSARVVCLLNKAHPKALERARPRRIAPAILKNPRVNQVLIGAVKREKDPIFETHRRIAAIILAAGTSKRMGTCKVLLPWGKKTVIETIVQTLVPFHLDDLVVVTGDKANEVSMAVRMLPARTVFNSAYESGEMLSSLKVGIKALRDEIDACLVIMGDQPQLKTRIVSKVLNAYRQGAGTIIAPYYLNQRGHPILIQRRYWQEILNLHFQSAPREVIERHADAIHPIRVDDDSILRDIDTPEAYEREKRLAGLE